jgi:hypothetical protein
VPTTPGHEHQSHCVVAEALIPTPLLSPRNFLTHCPDHVDPFRSAKIFRRPRPL